MIPDTVALFNKRYEEGYDVGKEFYRIWSKLKTMRISNSTNRGKDPLTSTTELSLVPSLSSNKSSEASPVLNEILT